MKSTLQPKLNNLFDDAADNLRGRIVAIYAILFAFNIAAWLWASIAFHHYPVLLGTALLAYSFGLRHAVDADHIAAIDNVTRKLMQDGKRPVAVGFMFSLGHSTVVVLGSAAIAGSGTGPSTSPRRLQKRCRSHRHVGLCVFSVCHRDRQSDCSAINLPDLRQESVAASPMSKRISICSSAVEDFSRECFVPCSA